MSAEQRRAKVQCRQLLKVYSAVLVGFAPLAWFDLYMQRLWIVVIVLGPVVIANWCLQDAFAQSRKRVRYWHRNIFVFVARLRARPSYAQT